MKHCKSPSNKVLRPTSFTCNVYSIAVQTQRKQQHSCQSNICKLTQPYTRNIWHCLSDHLMSSNVKPQLHHSQKSKLYASDKTMTLNPCHMIPGYFHTLCKKSTIHYIMSTHYAFMTHLISELDHRIRCLGASSIESWSQWVTVMSVADG